MSESGTNGGVEVRSRVKGPAMRDETGASINPFSHREPGLDRVRAGRPSRVVVSAHCQLNWLRQDSSERANELWHGDDAGRCAHRPRRRRGAGAFVSACLACAMLLTSSSHASAQAPASASAPSWTFDSSVNTYVLPDDE